MRKDKYDKFLEERFGIEIVNDKEWEKLSDEIFYLKQKLEEKKSELKNYQQAFWMKAAIKEWDLYSKKKLTNNK